MTTVIFLVVLGIIVYRATTAEQRRQALHAAIAALRRFAQRGRKQLEPFRQALRERSVHAPATIAIAALNVLVFVGLVFGKGSMSDPATLLGWGASFGPRTTGGEWWRLLSAAFVHPGIVTLAIEVAALVHVGSVLERLIGWMAFVAIYAAAALFTGLATLTLEPTAITGGASGAIFGLYGALIVAAVHSWRDRTPLFVPLVFMKQVLVAASIVALGGFATGTLAPRGVIAALVVGATFAGVFVRNVFEELPPPKRLAIGVAAVLLVGAAAAFPLRGIADVRPEIDRLLTIETHTSDVYQTAMRKVRNGAMTTAGLAQVIDGAIVPELQAADARLQSLTGVPQDDRPRVDDAREYLRLRSESWRLRAAALRESGAPPPVAARVHGEGDSAAAFRARATARYRSSTLTLGRAETAERAALETLERLRPTTKTND